MSLGSGRCIPNRIIRKGEFLHILTESLEIKGFGEGVLGIIKQAHSVVILLYPVTV